MTPEHVFDIEGYGVEALADRNDLGRHHEQKYRVGIDEAPDQPGAGDAVDLRPRAGHPNGAPLRVAGRQFRGRHQGKLGSLPALKTALERFRTHVEVSQPGRSALGELLAAQADDDGRTSGEFTAPTGVLLTVASD